MVASTSITDVMLVNQSSEDRVRRQMAFNAHEDENLRTIWVEHFEWVKNSIKDRKAQHVIRPKEGMPGHLGRFVYVFFGI